MYQKYQIYNETIPQSERESVNEKILYLIETEQCEQYGITKEIIYNSYTGGHFCDFEFKDFDNFHEYSLAKREIQQGQFFSPHHILKFVMQCIKPTNTDLIGDLTSGKGDIFNFAPVELNCYGNEFDIKGWKTSKYLYPQANITLGDIRTYDPPVLFDIIFGNPPFSLKWFYNGEEWKSENFYVKKSYDCLKAGGLLCLLVPQSFLSDEFFSKSNVEFVDSLFNFICQFDLPNNSFKHVGINSFPTKLMFFQKKSELITERKCNTNKLSNIINFDESEADYIYETYLKEVFKTKNDLRVKLQMEDRKKDQATLEFEYKIKKLGYDIKRNPLTKDKYNDCISYLHKMYNQKKPDEMEWSEWDKVKITPNKVLAYYKRVIKNANKVERDEIRLVKCGDILKLKPYSGKMIRLLNNSTEQKEFNINQMVYFGEYLPEDKKYSELINRKINEFKLQSLYFSDMELDDKIQTWLNEQYIYDRLEKDEKRLNDVQKEIVNKQLQKRYGYIQASQGSGKTLMSIFMALYRQKFQNTKFTFVVAPSIAINTTWKECLTNYQIPFTQIKRLSDIGKIKKHDFVIVTFNMLSKYQKQIKKFLKINSYNCMTILDEADNICNINNRFKAVMNVTYKSKYKLALSGTMSRNFISESFTQFLWLYGSSYNFMNDCPESFKKNKDGEIESINNDGYMQPFKMYRNGLCTFKENFNPDKTTVFGIKQQNQQLYNIDILKKLINKTIITKTLEEVMGRKIYEIYQNIIPMSSYESNLYNKAINEFFNMKYLFTSTGCPRRDKYLEILQQLNLLLDICKFPQHYKEYQSNETPTKYKKVIEMLGNWNDEYVAIGVRTRKEVKYYESMIKKCFKDRDLFIITGDVPIEKRRELIKELQKTKNGILLSTQQSLSSSVNIDFINKVIITSLSWSYSVLSQYFFRFVRYNSVNFKEIHFILYENSLELNLLGLLMAKERMTRILKNEELDDNELNEEFGVDFDLIEMLLSKEKDSEGKVKINWGKTNY
jgi:superfamily II DNA or RNA helicase